MKRSAMLRGLLVLCGLLLTGLSLYAIHAAGALEAKLLDTQELLRQAEEARISSVYTLQKELEAVRQSGVLETAVEKGGVSFADALRAGEIKSVLIIGDSISDGNGDKGCLYKVEDRQAAGCRKIMEADGAAFYENAPDSQGWVKYFRDYLLTYTTVETVDNNAIGGKSAKWGNTHKEDWIPGNYDAIFVMLGTNDRGDCLTTEEFYIEYAQLLSYADSKCSYLQVLTPTPVIAAYDSAMHMDIRQIADTVLDLCAGNGYPCVNLYAGLLEYAAERGKPLDEFLADGTHCNTFGYLSLWRLIAGELGLNLPVEDVYDFDETVPAVYTIGSERADITESTPLSAATDAGDIFPLGVSIYRTRATTPFKADVPYGGVVVTKKSETGSGSQIFKPYYYRYDFIRYAGTDGIWGEWSITNRDQFYKED